MRVRYVVFAVIVLFSLINIKPEFIEEETLKNNNIKVIVIDNNGNYEYDTTLNITISEFLKDNNLKANKYTDLGYRLGDGDIINISSSARLSINYIDEKSLSEIPYISENNARDIVSYREEYGHFKSFDQVLEVKGIGESKLKILKEYLTL